MTDRKPFLVRMDPAVHEALERWARDELRSLNAQVEFVIREALRRAGRLGETGDGRRETRDGTRET